MNEKLCRTLHPEVRIADKEKGIVDYVASDETLDHYKEIIRASGWRFTHFQKNAPFVDSHDYQSIDRLLGTVVDVKVADGKLVERVQWAIDVPDNRLAQLGWKMTLSGYLRAVSVGFYPTKAVSRYDQDKALFLQQLDELGLKLESQVRTVFLEQEQVELSSVILGANPNALAKAYKAGAVSDEDLDFFSQQFAEQKQTASSAIDPAADEEAQAQRARTAFVLTLKTKTFLSVL